MILLVAGTRPEVVKLAPVYAEMKRRKMDCSWLFTGQQADIGLGAFKSFSMTPEYRLEMDRPTGSLPELMAKLSQEMEQVLRTLMPELVVVQGDTLSAAVAAQSAFLGRAKVAHVEAGLRSWDMSSPYPEEACRVWIDAIADWKFAPTQLAASSLSGEVWVTGNTAIDALAMVRKMPAHGGKYAVVTAHRRENLDRIGEIGLAIAELAESGMFDSIVWPLHPNPEIQSVIRPLFRQTKNVRLVKPLAYHEMVNLMRSAKLLLTDSGGLQEEALGLGVPCLVMRTETERPEGVHAGGARLVGVERARIVGWTRWLMENEEDWQSMASAPNPYGDGKAAQRIVRVVKAKLEGKRISGRTVEWAGA